jgi:hypothetical protein
LIQEDGIFQTVWNKLYRRHVLEGILFEKGKCHEDDFWTYQIFDRMDRLAVVNRPMYHYLQRSGSIMGVGYRLKRLDGLEARYRRMEYLSKYDDLRVLTQQNLMLDYLWHLQSALRCLKDSQKETAVQRILEMKKKTPKVPMGKLKFNAKYIMWYRLFVMMPKMTARVRNLLGIGL